MFRGYPFQRLTESIGPWPATVVVSVLFAIPHLLNPNSTLFAAFNTAAVGALLAAAYLLTRSLWLAWGIHWGWNLVLAVAYGLSVSGFDTDGPVDGVVTGPAWLTGGAYGPEASALTLAALAVVSALLVWWRRAPNPAGAMAPVSCRPSPRSGSLNIFIAYRFRGQEKARAFFTAAMMRCRLGMFSCSRR